MFKLTKLKNGLWIITVPLKGTQAVTVLILVRAGSRYESEKENGLAHFLEHMFFKGGKRYPNMQAVSSAIDSVGGVFNAFTGKEVVGYWVKLASKHLERALDVLSDMLLSAKFDPQEIEKEKGVIIEEANLYQDNPLFLIHDLFEETIFGATSLGRRIVGQKKYIRSFQRQHFLNYLKRLYVPQNMVICLAGQINHNKATNLIQQYFPFSSKRSKLKHLTLFFKRKLSLSLKFKKTDQAHLILGFWGLPFDHCALPTLGVINALLAGTMSSRIFLSVRGKHGLAYAISSTLESYQDAGYWDVYVGTRIGDIEKTITLILKEIEKIKREKVSLQELKKAQEFLKGKLILNAEDSEFVANLFAQEALFRPRKIKTFPKIFKEINAVTPEMIKKLAGKLFRPENLNLAICGPYKNKRRFEKLIQRNFN